MQTANALVALGGDKRNTVPKTNITVAEVLALRAIHGEDAVHDIDIVGETEIAHEDLRDYLRKAYPAKDEDARLIVDQVFPGVRPQFPLTFDEINLDENLYKPMSRATPAAAGYKKKGGGKKTEPAEASADIFTDPDPMG